MEDFTAYGQGLYYARPANDNYEGFRLHYDEEHGNGWALIRMSLHDPVLPINVESNIVDGNIKIVKDLYYFLKKYDFLDLTPFEKSIESWRARKTQAVKEKFTQAKN